MKPPAALVAWARRADRDQGDWDRRAVDSWAQAVTFSHPVKLGEAEAAVMARDYPPLPGHVVAILVGGLGWIGVGFLAVITAGPSLVGLGLLVLGESLSERPAADDVLLGACFAFIVATIAALTYIGVWWETRRRGTFEVLVGAITFVASASACAAYLLMEITDAPWLLVFILCAAISGIALLIVELGSKPEGRAKSRKPPLRGPKSGGRRAQVLRARRRLLQILVDRKLVELDEADLIRVDEMPLGYWAELDGVDEVEWRRILELRHVGWHEFDEEESDVH